VPLGGEFVFDLGGRVVYQLEGPEEKSNLWSLRTRLDPSPDDVDILSLSPSGNVSLFTMRGTVQNTKTFPCKGGWIPVQPDATSNGGPGAG
jgi:hypothetical protein